MYNTVYRIWRM